MGSSFVFTLLGNSRGILQLEFWLKEFLFTTEPLCNLRAWNLLNWYFD